MSGSYIDRAESLGAGGVTRIPWVPSLPKFLSRRVGIAQVKGPEHPLTRQHLVLTNAQSHARA